MSSTTKALRDKDTNALKKELAATRRSLFDMRSQAVVEKLEDTSKLRKNRRQVARLETLLRERELAAK